MTSPAVSLTTISGGLSRLRTKGAALKTSLYQFINGYVTMEGTLKVRPGTDRTFALDNTTKGLAVYKETLYVFNNVIAATPSTPSGVVQRLLISPNGPTDTLVKIWFAKPFLGFLYVAAEFASGTVAHYWLQSSGVWMPNTVYFNGDIVVPTTGEVLAYLAQRTLPPNSVWSPQVTIIEGQFIEPTVYNGYYYEATAVAGVSPHTGSVEPTWPTQPGATIQEFGDFGTTSGASDSSSSVSTATALPPSITDRYGNSASIAGQTGTFTDSSGTPGSTVVAQTNVTTWAPGTLYVPGAVVQPSTNQGAFIDAIPNGDFEAGATDWVFNTPWAISSSAPFQGSQCAEYSSSAPFTADLIMTDPGTVTAGQSVTATAQLQGDSDSSVQIKLSWYDNTDTLISSSPGTTVTGAIAPHYMLGTATGVAPPNAVGVRVALTASTGSHSARAGRADVVSWNLETPAAVSNFIYEAIQAQAGTSASTEPTWPTTEGDTVVDGGVTWQAVGSSIITWTAHPIMQSGATEPTWPTIVGTTVSDGTMAWQATDRRVTDPNCPHSKIVCIGASHVFAGDNDIVPYSAAVDPTDWSSSNNAGYLPTGLNDYGDNPVAALFLYRSNLVVMNGNGYQMWQIDPDPTNMSILDAEPVPCIYTRSGQPANDDLVFLSPVGIRNIATAGASGNLQAGNFGKQVDAIVKELLNQLPEGVDPLGMFYPGTGQYLLFFGSKSLVLTINGTGAASMSWSQYWLPYVVTDWVVLDGVLYIRTTDPTAGDLVLGFNADTLADDLQAGGASVAFTGTVWYQYLDLGPIGLEKMMEGFDLSIDGTMALSVGYNQKDITQVTDSYEIDGDTMGNAGCVPFPVSASTFQIRLEIDARQAWEIQMLNVYVVPENQT